MRTPRWLPGMACAAGMVTAIAAHAASQQQHRLPPKLVYGKSTASPSKVIFSHEFHVAASDKCTACHVRLFRMLRPARQVSHADMEAGRSCGACHNGQMAFGPTDPAGCTRCHVGEGKSS